MSERLKTLAGPPATLDTPVYDRSISPGIVHIGVGAFHKAHQAVYTHDAMQNSGGGWMATGVSLRSPDAARALNPQNGLYTLLERGPGGDTARIIGSIANVLVAPEDPVAVLEKLAAPETKIVSLTVSEKGYGLDAETGGLDRANPSIAADLEAPRSPQSAIGFIVEALRLRRERGLGGFTVLSCDNLPGNGAIVRRLVMEFAHEVASGLEEFVAENAAFPSTMVDRITPASTDKTRTDAAALTGRADHAAVETEPFSQWVIEDNFVRGRPDWETGGAQFVVDVAPFEKMKLRMLNGAHSLLAYAGFPAGREFVRDAMDDRHLASLVDRLMKEAAGTLDALPGLDLDAYRAQLRTRFANPAIAHATYQIAMDGTQKLPQRLLEPAVILLQRGQMPYVYAFAVAAWMRYCLGVTDAGERYALRDPREGEIRSLLAGTGHDAVRIVEALATLPGLFPVELVRSKDWLGIVGRHVEIMLSRGTQAAIDLETGSCA